MMASGRLAVCSTKAARLCIQAEGGQGAGIGEVEQRQRSWESEAGGRQAHCGQGWKQARCALLRVPFKLVTGPQWER